MEINGTNRLHMPTSPDSKSSPDDEPKSSPEEKKVAQFSFERLVVHRSLLEEIPRQPVADGEVQPSKLPIAINISAAIQLNPEALRAILTMDFGIVSDPKWQPYRIEVKLAGLFAGQNITLEQFDAFCRTAAPAILFPYLREIVYSLTRDALYGVVKIDPINVSALSTGAVWGDAREIPKLSIEPPPPSEQ